MAPLRALFVAGTRPEAIKLAPLLLASRDRPGLDCTLVATGQHDGLFHAALAAFGLCADHVLGPCTPDLTIDLLARRIAATLPALLAGTDIVIVQGDTTSAWAAARVAHAHGVPVAHVEAGLRSGDPELPWPEEPNRVEIDRLAALLFAPCAAAAANLDAERVGGAIHVTGNSGIDALLIVAADMPAPTARRDGKRRLLVTCHRRESHGAALDGICAAIRTLAATRGDIAITVALPGDPGKAGRMAGLLAGGPDIALVQPLDYRRAVAMFRAADLVLSDSGGLQEECAALGAPLLVLRDNSERPEVIAAGNALLVGTAPAAIVGSAIRLLDDPPALAAMARPSFPYGRGEAARAMLDLLEAYAADRDAPLRRFASTLRPPSLMGPARRNDGERLDTR